MGAVCRQRSCDPLRPTVKDLLMFLHSLCRKGMSCSSLSTARSAVSNLDFDLGQNPNHVSIGKQFLVSKYLKGVFHEIKPVPKSVAKLAVMQVMQCMTKNFPKSSLKISLIKLFGI